MSDDLRCNKCGARPHVEEGVDGFLVSCECLEHGYEYKASFDLEELPNEWTNVSTTLDDLTERAREDYVACVEKGLSYNEQARRRDVAHTTVMANVERAKEQLGGTTD